MDKYFFWQGLSTQLITRNSGTTMNSDISWPHQKPTKTNSSLQMGTKQTSTGAYRQEEFSENLYSTFQILTKKHPPKSRSGLLRIYSLQCLTQNSLKERKRQPLCDLRDIRKMDKWENQSLDDLLDLGPRPWGISRGVTDQHLTHIH